MTWEKGTTDEGSLKGKNLEKKFVALHRQRQVIQSTRVMLGALGHNPFEPYLFRKHPFQHIPEVSQFIRLGDYTLKTE